MLELWGEWLYDKRMIGICYFIKENKIEESMCKWILKEFDLGRYFIILD